MGLLHEYKKEEFIRLSWNEYGGALKSLGDKIEDYLNKNKISVDVVVPIMRGGLTAGSYLAYRFGILKIVPVQYKYFFEGNNGEKIVLRNIVKFNKEEINDNATILVVEQDHCFGNTGSQAVLDIKKHMPNANILYAADYMDYSFQKNEGTENIFYGVLTNHTKTLTIDECKEKMVFEKIYFFPWENMNEEFATVSSKQFNYRNFETIKTNSEIKRTFDN